MSLSGVSCAQKLCPARCSHCTKDTTAVISSVGKWAVLSAVIFDWGRVHTAAVISVSSELYDNQVLSYKPGFSSADMTQWYKRVMTPPF